MRLAFVATAAAATAAAAKFTAVTPAAEFNTTIIEGDYEQSRMQSRGARDDHDKEVEHGLHPLSPNAA